jgi:peptidoglycan/LPS O-acetylase OafA/YrhL
MSDRVRYLDGLRGILAIIVFIHHYLYAFYPDLLFGGDYQEFSGSSSFTLYKFIALTPLNIVFNPGMAIHFFFLLSGYVQTYNYFQKPDYVFLQKSFIKRYFRLALPTLSVILIIFIFHKLHFFTKELIPKNPVTSGWVESILPDNLNFFQAVKHGLSSCFASNSRYYQVLWTMPTELYNSWMIMILLFITHQLKNKNGLFIFWILIQCFVLESYFSVAFTIGMMLCGLEKNSVKFKKVFSRPFIMFLCAAIGLYFASYPHVGYQGSTRHSFYAPISFFEVYPHIISFLIGDSLLLCFLMHSIRSQEFFSKKIFLFFGKISFMFYLVHLFLLLSFTPWFYNKLHSHMGMGPNLIISGIVSFAVISFASYALYLWVDKPVIKYCSIYLKKFFGV